MINILFRSRISFFIILCAICLYSLSVVADFYAKVPEFNPGDGPRGYDLYQPPWYPYDIEEAKNYTVNEAGEMIKRDEDDDFLINYEKPKPKAEQIEYTLKEISKKLVFEKVLGSPDIIVLDFYGHIPYLAFDLPGGWSEGGQVMKSGVELEYGGYPPMSGANRMIYDSWVIGLLAGWGYSLGGHYPNNWDGLLVPNLREFAVYLTTEGATTAKHALVLVERDTSRTRFNPGVATLKALSGEDYGRNAGKWNTDFVSSMWAQRHRRYKQKFDSWEDAVKTLIMTDLTSKRVPAVNAFKMLRDVPELSEPLFLEVLEKDKATLIMKRNLASLLEKFSSPRAAAALHKLVKDEDTVTSIRALHSLSNHPHGRVRDILINWLDPKVDDVKRAKAILMMGKSQDQSLGQKLVEFFPNAADDMEKELILRSLMRLRYEQASELFNKHLNSDFETLAYTSKLGKMVLDDLKEGQVMEIIDDAFYPEVASPGSGKVVSFAQKFRIDLIKYMAHSPLKKPRRRLWKYIREYQDMGPGAEKAGVAHILAYGLYELELGDDIIPQKEAAKLLHLMASRSSTDIQIRLAALTRLYAVDQSKCLDVCKKTINRFLKGRKTGEVSGSKNTITESDFLFSAINLVLIDNPDQDEFVTKIMTNPNIGGHSKSILLENLFQLKKKKALNIIKKNLKYYTSRTNLSEEDRRYLIRLLRFAGMFRDPKVLKDVVGLMEKSSDEWIRFICLYSLRLAIGDHYENVISGSTQERTRLAKQFKNQMNEVFK